MDGLARTRAKLSLPVKAAGCDTAVADIIDWLAGRPKIIKATEALGNSLKVEVIGELDGLPGDSQARRKAMVNHFWCDLLASLASALDKLGRLPDRAAEEITSAILKERKREKRSRIERLVILVAAKTTAKVVRSLNGASLLVPASALKVVRILAVLICPSPERHPAVYRHCMKPLADEGVDIISADTRRRLLQVFSAEPPPSVQP